ncbi:MAG: outer membrane beta-barrel protein [Terracidiphilus sp.]
MFTQTSWKHLLRPAAGVILTAGLVAAAQAPADSTAPASTPTPATAAQAPAAPAAPAAAPATPPLKFPWKVGPMAITGFIDGYYSYNYNQPTDSANGQINDLYNFNDKTDTVDLSAVKLTLNHDPAPFGAHFDFMYGRTNGLVTAGLQGDYIEQAFLSLKPPAAKGFEADFGRFVTSAGAEVIEAKDNWNYSRSLLFSWAIPYTNFGLRTSMPVSKVETIGVQVVNGWNVLTKNNGWATVGLTSALVKTKYTWNVNVYTGPEHALAGGGYRNLVDTTLLLTPNSKFNAYINYDWGWNHNNAIINTGETPVVDKSINTWQGVAFAAHQQINAAFAVAGRYEYFTDPNGFETGTAQHLNEFTGTFEYKVPKMPQALVSRAEYRHDQSDEPFFHKNATGMVDAQSTVTVGLILILQPHQ